MFEALPASPALPQLRTAGRTRAGSGRARPGAARACARAGRRWPPPVVIAPMRLQSPEKAASTSMRSTSSSPSWSAVYTGVPTSLGWGAAGQPGGGRGWVGGRLRARRPAARGAAATCAADPLPGQAPPPMPVPRGSRRNAAWPRRRAAGCVLLGRRRARLGASMAWGSTADVAAAAAAAGRARAVPLRLEPIRGHCCSRRGLAPSRIGAAAPSVRPDSAAAVPAHPVAALLPRCLLLCLPLRLPPRCAAAAWPRPGRATCSLRAGALQRPLC